MVQRCPECGQRLKTNYCDICMRKVPFGGVKQPKYREPWDVKAGSSAHRMEKDHECISFEKEEKKSRRSVAPKTSVSDPKKVLQIIAIVMAVILAISANFGLIDEIAGSESIAVPEPTANVYDGFVAAGDPGAEDVPKVITGELYNADGICVTVDSAGLSYGAYTVCLTIRNASDHNITVSGDLFSINGYMYPYGLYHEVNKGKTVQTLLSFYDSELERYGVKQIRDIEFVLDIYDEYNYESTRELVCIETELPQDDSAAAPISGVPLYSNEDLTVLLQDISLDGSGDCILNLYMQNHSQNTLNVYSGAVWVNGEEVNGYIWKMLRPNTCAIDDGYIYQLDEPENLGEIKEITIDLYVEYMDDLEIIETVYEPITFEPGAVNET